MTQQEQGEEHTFLDAVMQTRPMQYVHSYLAQKVARSAWRFFMHLYSSLACLLSMHTRSGLLQHMHLRHIRYLCVAFARCHSCRTSPD